MMTDIEILKLVFLQELPERYPRELYINPGEDFEEYEKRVKIIISNLEKKEV